MRTTLSELERYQYIVLRAHRDGRLTLLRRRRSDGKDLKTIRHNPEKFEREASRKLSLLPKWQMFAPIMHDLGEALRTCPEGEGERETAVRHCLFRLGKDFGLDCKFRHGLVYWYLKDSTRRVIAWQIQSGSYSERTAKKLLKNRAIYRTVLDIREDDTVRAIALNMRES